MKSIIPILIVLGAYGASWAATVGIAKLITVCFGWEFSLPVATGIWLILTLAKSILSRSGSE